MSGTIRAPCKVYHHRHLLENNVLTLSRIFNLESVSERRVLLICLPLAIRGFEASMTRAVVIEGLPEEELK
jgi:kynurenine formamidase